MDRCRRSNLGCALTMLGQRMPGIEGVQRIEHAIDVLSEAAFACPGAELLEERASAYVNLCRSLPGHWRSARCQASDCVTCDQSLNLDCGRTARCFAPQEFRWLLELDAGGDGVVCRAATRWRFEL